MIGAFLNSAKDWLGSAHKSFFHRVKVSFPEVNSFVPFYFIPSHLYINTDTIFLYGEILYRNIDLIYNFCC